MARRPSPVFATALWAVFAQLAVPGPVRQGTAQGAEQEVELQLKGRFVDTEGGKGVPDVVVRLFGRPGRHVSGPDGTLSLDVPPGRYTFTTWKSGYATVEGSLPVGIAGEFTVSMYRLDDVELGIPARLVVRVGEYGSGRPIEGAVVSLQGGGVRESDARGMAEFTDLREPVAELSVGMIGYAQRTEQVSLQLERTTMVQIGHDRGGNRAGTPRGEGALTIPGGAWRVLEDRSRPGAAPLYARAPRHAVFRLRRAGSPARSAGGIHRWPALCGRAEGLRAPHVPGRFPTLPRQC